MLFYMTDWLFIARFFKNIHRSGVLTVLAWLVPHQTAAVSAQVLCTPYNHAPCHFMQSHIRKMYACLAVTCHLHFWQNDRDLLRATVVTRGGTDTEIRVSTESWPWRRRFSRRSCRDSNPRPFSHESGALTTELSPPKESYVIATSDLWFCIHTSNMHPSPHPPPLPPTSKIPCSSINTQGS